MHLICVSLLLVMLLAGCQTQSETQPGGSGPPQPLQSATDTKAGGAATEAVQVAPSQDKCVRGTPTPILSGTQGRPAPTVSRTGTEELVERYSVNDSVELIVRHFGCTHYAVEYTFFLRGQTPASRDVSGWLRLASELFEAIPVVPSEQKVVQAVSATLRAGAAGTYSYGDPLKVSEIDSVSVQVEPATGGVNLKATYDVAL